MLVLFVCLFVSLFVCLFVCLFFCLFVYLLVNSDGVEPTVHDADPTVFGGEDEECHQSSAQIVEIVFLIEPQVAGIGKALSLVHHVPNKRTVTVVELTFEKLTWKLGE